MDPYDDDDSVDDGPDPEDRDDSPDTLPCPECGALVFDDTDQCPHCGRWIMPLRDAARPSRLHVVVSVILVALLLVWLLF